MRNLSNGTLTETLLSKGENAKGPEKDGKSSKLGPNEKGIIRRENQLRGGGRLLPLKCRRGE